MIPRHLAMLCLSIALTGCDDTKISNVARRLIVMSDGPPSVTADTSMLVEIHGVPWVGVSHEEITGAMKMPDGPARKARFVAVGPGESRIGSGERLVLHFNPAGTLDSKAVCRATGTLSTQPPDGSGFTLHAVFCRENEWLLQAEMKSGAGSNDWPAYHLAMEELLGTLFTVE